MLHCELAVQAGVAPVGKTVPPLRFPLIAGSQLRFWELTVVEARVMVPPKVDGQVTPGATFTVQAPVGTAAEVRAVEFWNPFWFRNMTALNVE